MAVFRIGTSGWHYKHWRGVFYPPDLPTAAWLSYYAAEFGTVEINNSFYRLPSEATFEAWRDHAPPGFTFAVKASRFLTHMKKLKDAEEPLRNILGRARRLGDHLGPILYQLPPYWGRDLARLEAFLQLLPSDVQHIFEFRDPSWLVTETFDLLRRYGAGLCIYDLPGYTSPLQVTAPFAYIRFHSATDMYGGEYGEERLRPWAERLRALGAQAETLYIYFNNDAFGYAVSDARILRRLLEA